MEQEIACPGSNGNVIVRAESIPFTQIPGQSKLFLQYQNDPLSLRKFYPSVVESHTEISERVPEVLANYTVDREKLCDALTAINRRMNASARVYEHISVLRDADCVAVLTGQQAGLFSGPLYTLYKALSAVRAAECLRGRGYKAVPVFWIATEDHDLDEVNSAFVLDKNSLLMEFETENTAGELPVGAVHFDPSVELAISDLLGSLKQTEFSAELKELLTSSYTVGDDFGTAFGKLLAALTSEYGLILVDPLEPELKRLAGPVYLEAVRRSGEIVKALIDRSKALIDEGYEAQVSVGEDYFPLFWHSDDGRRLALRSTSKGTYKTKAAEKEFTVEELALIAENLPQRLSPTVVLRPVVQDFLFPAVCYFGGGAEIAYFAQNSEVYRCMDRPVTPILHRQSFTVVEASIGRTMKRYDIGFTELFKGVDRLLPKIVDEFLDRETAGTFAEVEEIINTQLNRLDRELSAIDPTLAANLATRRRKIIYHIAALRKKFRAAELRKDETAHRRIESMFRLLLPNMHLQERTLNVSYFLNQHGSNFVDWMYRSVDLDDRSHRVLYL